MDFLYGYYPVLEALQAGRRKFYHLFLDNRIRKTSKEAEFLSLAKNKKIPVSYLQKDALEKLCQSSHNQHVVLKAGALSLFSFDELIKKRRKKLWVGLNRLQNPQNIGAILRSCAYFSVGAVFLSKHQTCELSASVSKSSAGAMENIYFGVPTNFNALIEKLKKENFWIIGASLAGKNFMEQEVPENCFLILGNEKEGIQKLVQKKCDFLMEDWGKWYKFLECFCILRHTNPSCLLSSTMKNKVLLINGPNLNLLGTRQTDILWRCDISRNSPRSASKIRKTFYRIS